MSNIEITFSTLSSYDPENDTIKLGTGFKKVENYLSTSEFSNFLADTITHEFLHGLLKREFNITVSKLFDTIEHLIGNYKLKSKVFRIIRKQQGGIYPQTWHDCIIQDGFDTFMCDYHLSKDIINEAYILCGGKQ